MKERKRERERGVGRREREVGRREIERERERGKRVHVCNYKKV